MFVADILRSMTLTTTFSALAPLRASRFALRFTVAYAGALLSYSIVVQKSIGLPRSFSQLTSAAYLQRLLMDDNVQYALLAAYWFVSGPVYRKPNTRRSGRHAVVC